MPSKKEIIYVINLLIDSLDDLAGNFGSYDWDEGPDWGAQERAINISKMATKFVKELENEDA